eukprot:scaffold2910_cov390-Prasinococcus_capsulatus_cf.AAC.4
MTCCTSTSRYGCRALKLRAAPLTKLVLHGFCQAAQLGMSRASSLSRIMSVSRYNPPYFHSRPAMPNRRHQGHAGHGTQLADATGAWPTHPCARYRRGARSAISR